jgi:succinoglycan biosynthesis protein ExoA
MPTVTIIVPCYNEQTTIRYLLEAIYAQTYPRSDLEVIIADALSEDGTRAVIEAYQHQFPDLSLNVVDNPARTIPSGVNLAIQAARGEFIVRMDAHSIPYPEYVERCVSALQAELGQNVGGVWEIRPGGEGWIAESIALAAAHPLGVGDALYRHARCPTEVDTVPFGAFRRSLIDRLGAFDESLLTNEDYEFNARIRQSGGRVWLDPSIRTVYFARATLSDLVRQYWRYGYWKWRMLNRYPDTLRWRQALPPLFVLSLIVLAISAVWIPATAKLLGLELFVYLCALLVVAAQSAFRKRKLSLLVGLPLAIATMHVSWGCGFLWGLVTRPGLGKNG